eukprot:gene2921-3360_t
MQYVNGLDVASSTFSEVAHISNDPDIKWDLISDKPDCKVWSTETATGMLQFKCVGEIDCSSETLWNVLYRIDLAEKWDDFCLKSKNLEELDSLNFIDFVAFASPMGGSPRYFCFFRSCSMDLINRRFDIVFRSIDHQDAENEIHTLDHAAFFTDLRPSGYSIEEITPSRTKITLISQVGDANIRPFVANDSVAHFKKMYRQSALHCLYKIPSLSRYIHKMNLVEHQALLDEERFGISSDALTIFKEVSDAINNGRMDSWNLFRKQREIEFYYRDSAHDKIDILSSGCVGLDGSPELVQTFLLSVNTHLIDSWTYHCEVVHVIDSRSSIVEIKFRSILSPTSEISHFLLKQVIQLPLNIVFIGFKSINYLDNSSDFWFAPSGYFIMPSEKGCSLRYLLQFSARIPNLKSLPKKKLLMSLSEKVSYSLQSLKCNVHHFNTFGVGLARDHPRWDQLGDKSVTEVLDLFFTIAIDQDKNHHPEIADAQATQEHTEVEEPNTTTHSSKKRKHVEFDESSIMTTDPRFCFTRKDKSLLTSIPPIPFTQDWERYIKRRPFLLLVSSKRTHCSEGHPTKTPRYNNSLNTNSLFDWLPEEIIQYIFSFLLGSDLARISMTCQTFHDAATNDYLWRTLFDSKFKATVALISQDSLKNSQGISNWRRMYIKQESIETNWRKGRARTSHLRGHRGRISCLQFGPEMAVTGSRDKELKLWNIATKQCDITLRQTTSSVVSFEKDHMSKTCLEVFPYCLANPSVIRIGYANGLIYHYSLVTKTIVHEKRMVYLADGFVFDKDRVIIWESNDIQIWDEQTSQKTTNLLHDRTKIQQCRLADNSANMIYSACTDKTVKLWDLLTPSSPPVVLTGHTAAVNCFEFFGEYNLVTGSNDKSVRLWDIRKPSSAVQVLRSHKSHVRSIKQATINKYITGDDTSIMVWSMDGGLLSQTCILDTFQNGLTALTADEETVIAGFNDGVVKYYDFSGQQNY